jgi:hypothetical protein
MPKGFLPNSDGGLASWARHFSGLINQRPEAYGIAPERAEAFAVLSQQYDECYAAAANLGMRSRAIVTGKNVVRAALKQEAKLLALTVHGCPTVAADQKVLLGLTVAKERPSPTPRLAEAPSVSVAGVPGRRVEVRLYDRSHLTSGARPPGASGALVFIWSGEGEPPADPGEWRFALNTGRRRFTIQFPLGIPPGRRVYVIARWYNARKENGPFSEPRGAELLGGGMVSFPTLAAAA